GPARDLLDEIAADDEPQLDAGRALLQRLERSDGRARTAEARLAVEHPHPAQRSARELAHAQAVREGREALAEDVLEGRDDEQLVDRLRAEHPAGREDVPDVGRVEAPAEDRPRRHRTTFTLLVRRAIFSRHTGRPLV